MELWVCFVCDLSAVLLADEISVNVRFPQTFVGVRITPEYAGMGAMVSVVPVVVMTIMLEWVRFWLFNIVSSLDYYGER